MKILFLSPRQPVPARSGAKLREYHFLRALGCQAEVTYLYFAEPGSEPLTSGDLPFCRAIVGIPKPPAYGIKKTIAGAIGPWPLPLLNYTSPAMHSAVASALDGAEFDFIHLDSIHMMRYAVAATGVQPGMRAIYNWHNIESEAMRRFAQTTGSQARAWYARRTAGLLERLETGILRSAHGHIVCSERERAQLTAIVPTARVEVVENGVDMAWFACGPRGEVKPRFIFVGSMDYFPNSDAVIYFATRIWPRVKEKLRDAEFIIVGTNPGAAVQALAELPGVRVTGMVPDVRPYYEDAIAAVVPLRTGGGTRLKILEAFAAGVPVISTPLGAEGLHVTDGENILFAADGDVDRWVERIVLLANSEETRDRLKTAALDLAANRYDWHVLGSKLVSIYRNWLQ